MAVIFPQQPLARRDPAAIVTADYEWLRVPHDPADVRAAIEALAVRFGLRFVRGDRWDFASTDPAVDGTVVVRPDDPGFASIGLRIAPSPSEGALREAASYVLVTWPLWLMIVMYCHWSGLDVVLAAIFVALGAAVLVLPAAGMARLVEAWRLRQAERWIAEWRGQFMPALATHLPALPDGRPYR
jgi:hypothetical protein